MSRREKERKESLSALGRIAEQATATPWVKPAAPTPAAPTRPPPPTPRPAQAPPPPPPSPQPKPQPVRPRVDPRFEGRKAKLEEEKRLRARRDAELSRATSLEWRGMSLGDVPVGVRRTAFDRVEPSVSQKIGDVLGAPREKEGRSKHREKSRRK